MLHRHLGASGLMVSEISYGNWLTHGSQIEEDAALACVEAALDAGITTFDTADAYANTRAESVLGRALSGVRREGVEIFTKTYWVTGPGWNDRGLSRKHIMEGIDGSLRRLQTDHVDLYQAHRYDHETPLEETMLAFADIVRQGKALYIGVSEWRAEEIRAAAELARELRIPLISNQPQYSMLWRVIEAEVVPDLRGARHRPDRLVADRPGRAHRQVQAGPAASVRLAGHRQGWRADDRALPRRRPARPGPAAPARSPTSSGSPWPSWPWPGCSRTTTWPRPSWAPAGPSRWSRTSRPPASRSNPTCSPRIDEIVGPVVERDPEKTQSPAERPRPKGG